MRCIKTLVWNLAFAVGSVLVTFGLGLACALALHADRCAGAASRHERGGPG